MGLNKVNQGIMPVVGRWLMGGVFLINSVGLTGAFSGVTRMMADKGVPMAGPLLGLVVVTWALGGACLVVGYRQRLAATALAALLVPVTLGMHAPWQADAAAFQNELNHFLTNVGLIGGLLCMARPPGRSTRSPESV